jgi:hypothetical protein
MRQWKTRTWLLLGAGTGLVIAFSTRWYWGLVAALLLSLLLAVSAMSGPPLERLLGRMQAKRRRA